MNLGNSQKKKFGGWGKIGNIKIGLQEKGKVVWLEGQRERGRSSYRRNVGFFFVRQGIYQ